ncbi:MAG: response regulator [Candidatus Firestonebacteria bacterium]|nr:response regulator [Candidatus Firestonebacteria bacterium]
MARILVVDDDGIIRGVTSRILENEGHQIDEAPGLSEALEKIKQTEFALALLDLRLPDSNGMQSIALLKELRPQMDVIVMTGYGTLDSVIEAMRAGAVDFLLKPCSAQQLRDTTKKVISKREISQENKILRALNEMKDKFLTLVSHELRTPLTIIYGYLSIMQRQGATLDKEQQELLGIVLKSTRQLISIVNNIQTITQAEAGEIKLHLQPVLPRKLISDALTEMKASIADRNLEMSLAEGEESPAINADSIRLRQALMELIQNAIRATPDGGTITVGAGVHDGKALLWVRDTGIGIPLAEQGKIFEPFYEVANVEQHGSSNSRFQGGGIGLGLSLVKAVVEAHHGSVRLESEPNCGTLIEISLPMDLENKADATLLEQMRLFAGLAKDAPSRP